MCGFSFRQTLILILLAFLFGGSALVGLGSFDNPLDPSILKLRYALVGLSLLLLLLMAHFDMWHFHTKKSLPLLLLWTLFNFVSVVSGLANNDSTSVRDGFWLMLGIPLIFFNALPRLMKGHANRLIALALFLGHAPYIIISLWLHPLTTSLYRGVFANANQLGSASTAMAASIFILLIAALSAKKSVGYVSLIVLLLLGTFTLILVANSRTSLLAFFAMFSIFVWTSVPNPKGLLKITVIATAIVSAILFLASEQTQLLWKNIELGFIEKIGRSETLSGRGYIWGKTLDDVNLLGHGSDYFVSNFGMGGHNTIIEVLGRSGIIATYLILCFAIASFLYAYLYFKTYAKEDHYAIAPLVITVCFWILAMGEGMFGSLGQGITLTYMLSMGIVMKESKGAVEKVSVI